MVCASAYMCSVCCASFFNFFCTLAVSSPPRPLSRNEIVSAVAHGRSGKIELENQYTSLNSGAHKRYITSNKYTTWMW